MSKPDIQALLQSAIQDSNRPLITARYEVIRGDYVNARTKVTLGCSEHGEFDILPRDIERRSYLCPLCRDEAKGTRRQDQENSFIQQVKDQFGDRFEFSELVYKDTQTPVILICKHHQTRHELYPFDLKKRTYICTDCRDEGLHDRFASTNDKFIAKAQGVHGDRYDYQRVSYHNASTAVRIVCPDHGEFEQAPRSHLSGRGCPKCGRASMADTKRKEKNEQSED